MSEQIQAISQGNYILHNIDAKKLYVQEPLFTANSGDAVYVGWRPDETVLFSATDSTGSTAQTITLSEPYSAFNKLRMYYSIDDGDAGMSEILTTNTIINCSTQCSQAPIGAVSMWKGERYYLMNGNQISASPSASMIFWNNTAGNNTTVTARCQSYAAFRIHQVVGVNRKENA
jgi:hypothetical protein